MKRTLAVVALLLLVAGPVLASEPGVYRSPHIPADLPVPPADGTVGVIISVWNGTGWATDTTVIVPAEHVLPTECVIQERPAA